MPIPTNESGFTLKKGKFYTTTKTTDKDKVKKLVRALIKSFIEDKKKSIVWILTGTHGTSKGELVQERKFFWSEDKDLETQYIKAVDVFNFTKINKIGVNSWNRYLGSKGIIILAWCYSEQSRTGWMKEAKLKCN
jgi:hypothetical protein